MRINEIITEARRNPELNNVRNGKQAAIEYLQSLPTLRNVFVHMSYIPKIGIPPMTDMTYTDVQPTGIYCYMAEDWLKKRGEVRFASTRQYINILTLKPNAKLMWNDKYRQHEQQLEKKLRSGDYPESNFTPGRMNGYYRKLGYDAVYTHHEGLLDWCILHTGVIAHVETFRDVVIGKGQKWGSGGGMDNGEIYVKDPRFKPHDNYSNPGSNWINWQTYRRRPTGKKNKWGNNEYVPNYAYPLKPKNI